MAPHLSVLTRHKGRYSARMTDEISLRNIGTLLHSRLLSSQSVSSKTNGKVLINKKYSVHSVQRQAYEVKNCSAGRFTYYRLV